MTGLIGGRRTIQTGKGCWEDVKKLLFVYVPQRAPAIVLSRRADCGLAFSQRSGRRNHRLRSKFLPQDIKELRNTLAIAVRAVANFFRLTGNRVLDKALVLAVDEKRSHGERIATDALAE